ncbi:lanthionine synthetase LanC family protein [Plantactinospora sp. ZYX-F-223]|uniref:class III lanthionine synthetase LanKC N-terminal domain-containing protein n=1 Tax=Plantactinospora sp. ZYX-F-223 TaxID=3144103 RepID=UPI0031FBD53E
MIPSQDRAFDVADNEIESYVERAVRDHAGNGYQLRSDHTWLMLRPDGKVLPEHGWKLHISARPATFPALVERLVPVLLAEGCTFKLARSRRVLSRLNDGFSSPASVGKAFTLYPDQDRVRELGIRLVDLLCGEQGPRVLSDRAIDSAAPVYYRYGPFVSSWSADPKGRLVAVIHGPNGEEFGGLATLRYRQPTWTIDPFTGERGDHDAGAVRTPTQLGGRYRAVVGVYESGRGNVYRAVDERDGATVVVKQARAHVDEHDAVGDTRLRLRNERRILQVLDGVPGVPRFVDHFRHGVDEFLVTSDAGPRNLVDSVILDGPYLPRDAVGRSDARRDLERLAEQLAGIVLSLHSRDILIRDLTPRNIVVDSDRVTLIDFGLAHHDGVYVPGGTPGYAPARQFRDEPPLDTDDLHALGMTLLFAAHALPPVDVGDDREIPRQRALRAIRARHGERPAGVVGAIVDLISGDADLARDAARRLAAGETARPGSTPRVLPAPPDVTPELAAEITGNLLADLLDQTRRLMATPPSRSAAIDASVYNGAAGVGLELLEHLDQSGVADCLRDLVPFTIQAMTAIDLPPGLMTGRTGVDLFLLSARRRGFDLGPGYPGPHLPAADWAPEDEDLMSGAAGVGLGHVLLHRATGDPAHLGVARRCAEFVLRRPVPVTRTEADLLPAPAAVEQSAGRAHGLAGTTELLLGVGTALGDDSLIAGGAERARALARRARSLAERMRGPIAASIAVSWCQGLSGITETLWYAGRVLDDAELADLARHLADVCTAFLPRVSVPVQCCGSAGVGNMLIDLAIQGADPRYWDAASAAGAQMLLRGAGTDGHPIFVVDDPAENSASWAFGVAGFLSFFRRLSRRGGIAGLPLSGWADQVSRNQSR